MSRAAGDRVADEQAALRRVAARVVEGAAPEEIFDAVAAEVGQLFEVDTAFVSRFDSDRGASVVGGWAKAGDLPLPLGTRFELRGQNIHTQVFETGWAARIDDYADASGPSGEIARRRGTGAAVGVPIHVAGRLWGVVAVGAALPGAHPPDLEDRLASFTPLIAIAVANAEAQAELLASLAEAQRLADEQAALRRVATLVARGASPEEIFGAVAAEVGRVLEADFAAIGRFGSDASVTFVGMWAKTGDLPVPVGTRLELGGHNAPTRIFETSQPARVDDVRHESSGAAGEAGRAAGMRASVGVPVLVAGRLWGSVQLASRQSAFPPDTEARLARFTELVGTAVANAEARAELLASLAETQRLADEQAALRRVATLVAGGASPEEIFGAVAAEICRVVLEADFAAVGRFGSDASVTYVGMWAKTGDPPTPVGTRLELGGHNVTTRIFETSQPARFDDISHDASGPVGEAGRSAGVGASVGVPIRVAGRLWGCVGMGTRRQGAFPPDTEARLAKFTELVDTAVANAEAQAELVASRSRVVAAAEEERRRIARDLHDAAQQRLVHTILTLELAQRAQEADDDQSARGLVQEALDHAQHANSELRELVHGIAPSTLTQGGLAAAVAELATRSHVPTDVNVTEDRFPAAVESTAYFVMAEALTNIAKHAGAENAQVSVQVVDGALRLEVQDDGAGGARPDGSGLRGLADRLVALGGELQIESPERGGTRLSATLPLPD